MIDLEIKTCIEKSVLCWLATSSSENIPNVSPKEIFSLYNETSIIVANIASPKTVKNIKENSAVCISFIDILVQKGFQIKGKAETVTSTSEDYEQMENVLTEMTGGLFPFSSIIKISIEQVKKILAPRYILFPETTEEEQIESARKIYNL